MNGRSCQQKTLGTQDSRGRVKLRGLQWLARIEESTQVSHIHHLVNVGGMGKQKAITVLLFLLTGRLALADLAPVAVVSVHQLPEFSSRSYDTKVSTFREYTASSEAYTESQASNWGSHFAVHASIANVIPDRKRVWTAMLCEAHPGLHGEKAIAVVELPPPPSGSVLTLSGLLTIGAMQVARSARDTSWAGIVQIGRSHGWYQAGTEHLHHRVEFEFYGGRWPVLWSSNLLTREHYWASASRFPSDTKLQHRSPEHAIRAIGPRGPPG